MIKTVAKIVGVIALLVAVIVAVDRMAGPFFSFSTYSWEPARQGDKMIGVVEGPIKSADAATQTLRVAAGFLGLGSLSLKVTADTIIGVRGKLGGVGDLDRGQLVRVAYEVAADRLVARRVQLLGAGSTTAATTEPTSDLRDDRPPNVRERRDAQPSAIERAVTAPDVVAVPPVAPAPVETPSPSVPPAPARTADDSRPPASPIEAAAPAEVAELPPRLDDGSVPPPLPVAPPAALSAPTPRPAAPPARRPASATPPTGGSNEVALPPRRQTDDSGAVIDWLINSPPARPQVQAP